MIRSESEGVAMDELKNLQSIVNELLDFTEKVAALKFTGNADVDETINDARELLILMGCTAKVGE